MNFFWQACPISRAHPDDIEIGCGALLHHIANQTDILCITLSDNQKNPDLANVKDEHYRSMALLGIKATRSSSGLLQPRISGCAAGNP